MRWVKSLSNSWHVIEPWRRSSSLGVATHLGTVSLAAISYWWTVLHMISALHMWRHSIAIERSILWRWVTVSTSRLAPIAVVVVRHWGILTSMIVWSPLRWHLLVSIKIHPVVRRGIHTWRTSILWSVLRVASLRVLCLSIVPNALFLTLLPFTRVLAALVGLVSVVSLLLDIVLELHFTHMNELIAYFVVQVKDTLNVFFMLELNKTKSSGLLCVKIVDNVAVVQLSELSEVLSKVLLC